ncbi:bifunctional nuclease domain-containing protein [Rubrivirga sp. IMCC45206]|uniref:bifunctional nuclease domain-containing protein n=1 Tax=Rubrivirga sp. IMCC45206 TaxID=3391614 RepID=UPI00398FA574
MDYIQVDIIGLSTSPSSGGAYALVLGEVGGNRRLPIIIGAFEAQAIALELEKIQPPRPMTHDLLRALFEAVGADVTDVVIDDLREGTFFAKVRYVHDDDEATLDARPSDAVALAVRTDAPLFVSASVLDEAGIPADDDAAEPVESDDRDADPFEAVASQAMSTLDKMESKLEKAIADEDYETAARLRDEIARMKEGN